MWCVCLSQLGFGGVCVCVVDVRYKAEVQVWSTPHAASAPSPARTRRWCGTSAIQWTHVASLPWWVSLAVYEAVEGPHKHSKINVRVCVCVCEDFACSSYFTVHARFSQVRQESVSMSYAGNWSRSTQGSSREPHHVSMHSLSHPWSINTFSLCVLRHMCFFPPIFRHNEATEDVWGTWPRVSLHQQGSVREHGAQQQVISHTGAE